MWRSVGDPWFSVYLIIYRVRVTNSFPGQETFCGVTCTCMLFLTCSKNSSMKWSLSTCTTSSSSSLSLACRHTHIRSDNFFMFHASSVKWRFTDKQRERLRHSKASFPLKSHFKAHKHTFTVWLTHSHSSFRYLFTSRPPASPKILTIVSRHTHNFQQLSSNSWAAVKHQTSGWQDDNMWPPSSETGNKTVRLSQTL